MAASELVYTFWLLCCGETTWSREGRIRGHTDLPLSNTGRSMINADLARLAGASIAGVYHPEDEAATETAHLVSESTQAKARRVGACGLNAWQLFGQVPGLIALAWLLVASGAVQALGSMDRTDWPPFNWATAILLTISGCALLFLAESKKEPRD